MGINPGNPAFGLPPADDDLARQLKDLERTTRENLASVVDSFKTTVDRLDAAIVTLDEAVASTVTFSSIGKSELGFAVPSVMSDVAASTILVPDGYTRAAILGIVSLGAYNGTTASGYVYLRAMINGTGGATLAALGDANGGYTNLGASAIRVLEGLTPGGLIPVSAQCQVDGGWPASSANIANIDVIALFRR